MLKHSGVFMLTPNSQGTFDIQKLTSDFGTVSHWSIIVYHTFAYWLDTKGVCEFNGQQVRNLSAGRIRSSFDAYAKAEALANSFGVQDANAGHQYLRWKMASLGAGHMDQLIYDLGTGAFLRDRPYAFDYYMWTVRDSLGRSWVHVASGGGKVYRLGGDINGNPVYLDPSAAVQLSWVSKWFGNGMDNLTNIIVEIEHEVAPDGKDAPMNLVWWFNGYTTAQFDSTLINAWDVNDTEPDGSKAVTRVKQFHCGHTGKNLPRRFRFGIQTANSQQSLFSMVGYRVWARVSGDRRPGLG